MWYGPEKWSEESQQKGMIQGMLWKEEQHMNHSPHRCHRHHATKPEFQREAGEHVYTVKQMDGQNSN